MYCAEQIKIPSELPEILKNYTKFIVKTQPQDVIAASAEYFGRIARQKNRAIGSNKLTNMQLEAVYKKMKSMGTVNLTRKEVENFCEDAGIPHNIVMDNIVVGGWTDAIPWIKFWALLVGSSAGTLHATVEVLCDILGDNDKISANPLLDIIFFLTERDSDIPAQTVATFNQKLQEKGNRLDISYVLDTLKRDIPAKLGAGAANTNAPPKTPEQVEKQTDLGEDTPLDEE